MLPLTDRPPLMCYGSRSVRGKKLCSEVSCSLCCVILQCNYHDPIPWYIWIFALIAQCVAFGEPAMRSATAKKN